jgi:hypothetical protein
MRIRPTKALRRENLELFEKLVDYLGSAPWEAYHTWIEELSGQRYYDVEFGHFGEASLSEEWVEVVDEDPFVDCT